MRLFILLFVFATMLGCVVDLSGEVPSYYAAQSVKDHFALNGKPALFKQLQKRFGIKEKYSFDEVQIIENPTIKVDVGYRDLHGGPRTEENMPYGALPISRIANSFEIAAGSKAGGQAKVAILQKNYGAHAWYFQEEYEHVRDKGDAPLLTEGKRPASQVVKDAERAVNDGDVPVPYSWNLPRILIRKDWTDVLFAEDMSQDGNGTTLGDLVGATFEYSSDQDGGVEKWNTIGSLIVPWVHEKIAAGGLGVDNYAIAPSVSVNRLSMNSKGDSTKEIDQLLYRVGVFGEWVDLFPGLDLLQLRGAAVYGTDTGHHVQMPGFEFDLEPRSFMGQGGNGKETLYKLGFRNTLWRKAPVSGGGDQSLLDYQLRIWLHMEGGDIENVSKTWTAVPESFFRLGPTAQLRINMPHLWRGFSISAQYSNLEPLHGPKGNNSLLKLDATLNLLSDKATGHKVALNASYMNGGMNFTREEVDLMTIGMSLRF